MRAIRAITLSLLVATCLLLVSCSSAEQASGPKPGTPDFFWAGAKEAYAKGDFKQTILSLEKVARSDSPNAPAAKVWLMAINSGLAEGDMAWAEDLEKGSKMSRGGQLEFRKLVTQARSLAAQRSIVFAELANQAVDQMKGAEIPIAFAAAPAVARPVELGKIEKGILPPAAEIEGMQAAMQKRGVGQTTAALAKGEKIPRADFLLFTAKEFVNLAELFVPKKLDQGAKGRLFIKQAEAAMAELPASAATKELKKKIADLDKKLPKTSS